jgi:hypothetical protein
MSRLGRRARWTRCTSRFQSLQRTASAVQAQRSARKRAGYGETLVLRSCSILCCRRREEGAVDDATVLSELNERFIEAFRQGSWNLLEPILSPSFSFLDGETGETWSHEQYVESLDGHPLPGLVIDQLALHVDGDTAIVSARTSREPGRYKRYVDTYERREGDWKCVHACVWPLT